MDDKKIKSEQVSWFDKPEQAEFRKKIIKQLRDDIVKSILKQSYYRKFAKVEVERNGCEIKIRWEFESNTGNTNRYKATVMVREVTLVPENTYGMQRMIYDDYGNGSINLRIPEGYSYFFIWGSFDSEAADLVDGKENRYRSDELHFIVSVPLSEKKRALLDKLVELESSPEEKIGDDVKRFLSKQNAFDKEFAKGVKTIKRKKLSPEEEEDQIARLRERMNQLRENLKM